MTGPERLGDLLPGVVAALTLSHTRNGALMPGTVWRYHLTITDRVTLDLPVGADVLTVGPPRSDVPRLDLWARVDTTVPSERRTFLIVGTGNPMPWDAGRYVGTTHSHDGALIWHVFETAEPDHLRGAA